MGKVHQVQKYIVTGIADVLSCFGIPTGVAVQLYQDVLEKRSAEALDILLSEIRHGNFGNVDQHDVISILARYQRDAMEGVAKNNLRLMAKVINGMAEKKELTAPSFLKYANVLAGLTAEEIMVIAIMVRNSKETPGAFWEVNKTTGQIRVVHDEPLERELRALVPNHKVVQQSLVRTGLISFYVDAEAFEVSQEEIKDKARNPAGISRKVRYFLTPLMDEITKYTDKFHPEGWEE